MPENKNRIVVIIVIGVLIIGNVFFALNYYFVSKDLQEIKSTESKTQLNTKIVDFAFAFHQESIASQYRS